MTSLVAVVVVVAVVMAITWNRRGGGLLPLALAVIFLSPLAIVGWLSAEWSRWWLARPRSVRRSLELLGFGELARGIDIDARRIGKGRMNAVLLATLTCPGSRPQRLVIKHVLRFGTLLGEAARRFGATREYPLDPRAVSRGVREVRALLRLRRRGLRVAGCLGYSLRHRIVAMEFVEGTDLAKTLVHRPELTRGLGQLLRRMHDSDYSMGDANPENMVVDSQGRIIPFDFEQSHFGAQTTSRKKGFDLAWAAAFLASEDDRLRFFDGYGHRSTELETATRAAEIHLRRFSPIVEWYGHRWRRDKRIAFATDDREAAS